MRDRLVVIVRDPGAENALEEIRDREEGLELGRVIVRKDDDGCVLAGHAPMNGAHDEEAETDAIVGGALGRYKFGLDGE